MLHLMLYDSEWPNSIPGCQSNMRPNCSHFVEVNSQFWHVIQHGSMKYRRFLIILSWECGSFRMQRWFSYSRRGVLASALSASCCLERWWRQYGEQFKSSYSSVYPRLTPSSISLMKRLAWAFLCIVSLNLTSQTQVIRNKCIFNVNFWKKI
jgi:hypothetical protein